jgi:prevent-host-death family protein
VVTVTFSELRNNARKCFCAVEEGQTIEVCRHGKPVAIVTPARAGDLSRWCKTNLLSE